LFPAFNNSKEVILLIDLLLFISKIVSRRRKKINLKKIQLKKK